MVVLLEESWWRFWWLWLKEEGILLLLLLFLWARMIRDEDEENVSLLLCSALFCSAHQCLNFSGRGFRFV